MTKPRKRDAMAESSEREFYDSLVDDYDAMTAFDRRLETAETFVSKLCHEQRVEKAADLACGTGLYTVALAKSGVDALGMDISPGMIQAARGNAVRYGVQERVRFVASPMQEEIDSRESGEYDAVLCMANSIPHLLDIGELTAAFKNFARLLRTDGVAVVQLLNYARILENRERIVSIDRDGTEEFIRFYDFLGGGTLRFNILRLDWNADDASGNPAHQLHSVRLRPYRWQDLQNALERNGFQRVQLYGSPRFTPFDPEQSATVMLAARKRAD